MRQSTLFLVVSSMLLFGYVQAMEIDSSPSQNHSEEQGSQLTNEQLQAALQGIQNGDGAEQEKDIAVVNYVTENTAYGNADESSEVFAELDGGIDEELLINLNSGQLNQAQLRWLLKNSGFLSDNFLLEWLTVQEPDHVEHPVFNGSENQTGSEEGDNIHLDQDVLNEADVFAQNDQVNLDGEHDQEDDIEALTQQINELTLQTNQLEDTSQEINQLIGEMITSFNDQNLSHFAAILNQAGKDENILKQELDDFIQENYSQPSNLKKCRVKCGQFLTSTGFKVTVLVIVGVGYLVYSDVHGLFLSAVFGDGLSWALTPVYWMHAAILATYEAIFTSAQGLICINDNTIINELVQRGVDSEIVEVITDVVIETATEVVSDEVVVTGAIANFNMHNYVWMHKIIEALASRWSQVAESFSWGLCKVSIGRLGTCSVL